MNGRIFYYIAASIQIPLIKEYGTVVFYKSW